MMKKGQIQALPEDQTDHFFGNLPLISSEQVREMLSMQEAIDLMGEAFASFSSGRSQTPQRYTSDFRNLPIDMLFKPAYSLEMGRIAVKILTQKKKSSNNNKPTIQGFVLLIDSNSGDILALIDGTYLTALRTGAVSGLATRLLAREDAENVAIFGCGAQGRTQLEAVCSVRSIRHAQVYDTNRNASFMFKEEMEAELGISINIENELKNLKKADIICTATNAESPLFFANRISKGVHINAIGSFKPNMQELDPQILAKGLVFADSGESVLKESGDLINPIQSGVIGEDCIKANIGDVVNGIAGGRIGQEDVTIFKSVGLAVQDLFVANRIYEYFCNAER